VKPVVNILHKSYTFYVLVTASGGSNEYFGPFKLWVGCTPETNSFADSPSFMPSYALKVGAPL
jgi:hypothetical protein